MSPSTVSFVAVVAAFIGAASSVPMQQQQQPRADDGGAIPPTGGFATVLWSVFDDCFDDDAAEPAAVCLKSKALTALDRALSKPTLTIADGVSLAARSGKSLADPQTERADRAALDAAKDSDHKNALLDDMLASRMDKLMTTRTIVMDGSVGQEEGQGHTTGHDDGRHDGRRGHGPDGVQDHRLDGRQGSVAQQNRAGPVRHHSAEEAAAAATRRPRDRDGVAPLRPQPATRGPRHGVLGPKTIGRRTGGEEQTVRAYAADVITIPRTRTYDVYAR